MGRGEGLGHTHSFTLSTWWLYKETGDWTSFYPSISEYLQEDAVAGSGVDSLDMGAE